MDLYIIDANIVIQVQSDNAGGYEKMDWLSAKISYFSDALALKRCLALLRAVCESGKLVTRLALQTVHKLYGD